MQSKDLRIGNYVWNDLPFGGSEVYQIKVYDFGCAIMTNSKPIRLTETIIIGLGFSYVKEGRLIKYFGEMLCEIFPDGVFFIKNIEITKKIKYVHELQNLYFALTGEELELKHESKP
jgi:hypothetical protein